MSDSRRIHLRLEQGDRLDRALLAAMKEAGLAIPRARLKELFRSGQVLVGGNVRSGSWLLNPGEHEVEILADLGALSRARALPSRQGSFLPVIYEDDDLLVIHKASGVPSIPHSSGETETAVGSALARFPELAAVGDDPLQPGVLHRLDTGTSGLLVFAKTPREYARLREAWRDRRVRKVYRALVASPEPGRDALRAPATHRPVLAHDPGSDRRMIVLPEGAKRKFRGKPLPTVTHLRAIRPAGDPGVNAWDAEIEIETGVMHQIRCTLAWLGWPVLGDPIYRGQPSSRLWLHAWKIALPLADGAELCLQSALPAEYLMQRSSLKR